MKPDLLLLTLKSDLLGNILDYAADIGKCSENITSQIREMIGARVVALFERVPEGEYRLLSSCPERKREIFKDDQIKRLVASIGTLEQATFIEPDKGEAGLVLAGLGMKESFAVPLRVGDESFGMLLLLDLMDNKGIQKILAALEDISGMLSLVFKNAFLYSNMEVLVEQRTRALRESEEKHKLFLEHAGDAIFIHNHQGGILAANPIACERLGYTRAELTSMTIGQVDAPEEALKFSDRTHQLIKHGCCIFETVHLHKDGSAIPVEVNARLITWEGKPATMSICRDMTERKKLEEEKNILQSQLIQAQKMEAIGVLAGGIAHDFNNILGAILGYAEMAQEDSPAGSEIANDVGQVVQAAHRAKELVKQILAFSRQADSERIPLQLSTSLKETIKLLRASLPSTIDIKQDIDQGTCQVFANPTQVHQVVMNLCTNAYHSMETTGGTLSISLHKKLLSKQDLASQPNTQPGQFVQLSIRDTGSGIAADIRDRIFDPYFTTKETGKGTGMGLAIVHGIAKAYGGFVTCGSTSGQGTVFDVLLPVIDSVAEPAAKADYRIEGGNERILFVDDEKILAEMGTYMLERIGYRVTTRTNSIEALMTFQNQPDTFDLVITDQTMPGMTGTDLARRMLQIRPGMPIILCTGYSSIITEEKAKSFGISGFAMKPLAKKDISGLIRKVLEKPLS